MANESVIPEVAKLDARIAEMEEECRQCEIVRNEFHQKSKDAETRRFELKKALEEARKVRNSQQVAIAIQNELTNAQKAHKEAEADRKAAEASRAEAEALLKRLAEKEKALDARLAEKPKE